jgi:serine/threonine-protein kinase
VLHQIGAGTLGPVFRAYDAKAERLVAVKLFRLDLPPERVHQLVAALEQLIAAELEHPAIATPIAAGITGAAAYLACDYVAAESLDLAVREYGPAPPPDALRVAAQLAGALDFSAAVSVSHGAMHPRDVLLSSDETRLTGIGIARALQAVGISAPLRRPYTAPERIAGRSWDRRADVFSLAALVHELLWGKRITGPAFAVDAVTPLTGADPSALQDVFARALAEDPDARFATALEFADALRGAFFEGDRSAQAAGTSPKTDLPPLHAEPIEHAVNEEARLPLDEPAPTPPVIVREPAVAAAAAVPPAIAGADVPRFDLREAEEERYRDVESSPAIAEPVVRRPHDPVAVPPPARSRMPAIAAAVVVALAVGALVGYGFGTRARPSERAAAPVTQAAEQTQPAAPVASPSPSPARETTDVKVDPPRASTPAPVKEPDVAPPPSPRAAAPPRAPERRTAPSRTATAAPAPRAADRDAERRTSLASATAGRFVGSLSVDSRPEGARVFLDGRLIGTTPVDTPSVGAGEHAIRIERDGYRRWSSSIRVVASEKTRVTASLER